MSKKPRVELKINENQLAKTISNAQEKYLQTHHIQCPHCGFPALAPSQKYNCPACRKEITIVFD